MYHSGDSPIEGHYVTFVKRGDTWYRCNDAIIEHGVKLNCDPDNSHDLDIPYLLMYEKDVESEMLITNVSHPTNFPETDKMIASNSNVDFIINKCYEVNEKTKVSNAKTA